MKRTVRIYKYTCDKCGWEAFRAEIIPADLCSRCGNTNSPIISTEDKEFEFSADVQKAAEYTKRLMAGEDPETLEQELSEIERNIMPLYGGLGRLLAGSLVGEYKVSPTEQKVLFGKPVVY
jgi:hypothetical protein